MENIKKQCQPRSVPHSAPPVQEPQTNARRGFNGTVKQGTLCLAPLFSQDYRSGQSSGTVSNSFGPMASVCFASMIPTAGECSRSWSHHHLPAPSAPCSSILKSHLLSLSPAHFMPSCQFGCLLCLLVSQHPCVILSGRSTSSSSAAQQCWWPLGPSPLLQHGVPAEFGTCFLASCRVWETIPHLQDCIEERGKSQPVLMACAVHGCCRDGAPHVPSCSILQGCPCPWETDLLPNTAISYPAPLLF